MKKRICAKVHLHRDRIGPRARDLSMTHHSASFGGKSSMPSALSASDDNSDPATVVPRAIPDGKVACP